MKKLVSFFGEPSELFQQLNQRTAEYAATKEIDFVWRPQISFREEQVVAELLQADAGLIDVEPYGESIFSQLGDRTKLLIRFGVGFDQVDLKAASKYGICCARTTGANRTGVAEMALMQILAARRQVMLNRKTVESGVWVKNIGHELIGGRVGILGFGAIGVTLARLLRGFECEVLAYDTYPNEMVAAELGVRFADMDEIFETCDAISVHLPYCPETDHLIGRECFEKMKKDAVIVCTARGNIIDEDALYEALRNGVIGGGRTGCIRPGTLPCGW